jgi:hypothetical protein
MSIIQLGRIYLLVSSSELTGYQEKHFKNPTRQKERVEAPQGAKHNWLLGEEGPQRQ